MALPVQGDLITPRAADRIARNAHNVAGADRAGCPRFHDNGFTKIEIRHDLRVSVDHGAAGPLHVDVGDLRILELLEEPIHPLGDFVQRADRCKRAAADLGRLAHEPAIWGRADTDCEQASTAQALLNQFEKTFLIADRAIGYEDDLPQVALIGRRSHCERQGTVHLGTTIRFEIADEAFCDLHIGIVSHDARRK